MTRHGNPFFSLNIVDVPDAQVLVEQAGRALGGTFRPLKSERFEGYPAWSCAALGLHVQLRERAYGRWSYYGLSGSVTPLSRDPDTRARLDLTEHVVDALHAEGILTALPAEEFSRQLQRQLDAGEVHFRFLLPRSPAEGCRRAGFLLGGRCPSFAELLAFCDTHLGSTVSAAGSPSIWRGQTLAMPFTLERHTGEEQRFSLATISTPALDGPDLSDHVARLLARAVPGVVLD